MFPAANIRRFVFGFLITFIVAALLKFAGVIALSWVWVCMPLWLPLILAGVVFLFVEGFLEL